MPEIRPDLALSRTFRLVGGVLSPADQGQQWAEVLGLQGGALLPALSGGDVIDSKYRILALIGAGGMGSVYRVQHLLLGKEMALKTFATASLTPDAWQRFQREAQSIAKLTHANIVQVFDFGIGQDNRPYYTMELLTGQSLADKIKAQGRLSLKEALPVLISAADALSHAHKSGIVHRDVKPANIFLALGTSGRSVVKVVDFGIAKLATAQNKEDQSQTDSGFVFGSPLYMSPEQSAGQRIDGRTDIYSFGCTVFEVLTGQPPFFGDNAFETLSLHHNRMPPRMVEVAGDVEFSQSVEMLVKKLLAKDPAKRHQSFDQVLADLEKVTVVAEGPRSLLENAGDMRAAGSQGNSQENTQGNTDGSKRQLAVWHKDLVIWGTGVLVVVTLAFVAAYFGLGAKNRPPPVPPAQSGQAQSAGTFVDSAATQGDGAAPYFYSEYLPDNRRMFRFPKDISLGKIRWGGGPWQDARGVLATARGVETNFLAGETLVNQPQLFEHFRPDDISNLACDSTVTWTGKHLKYLTRSLYELTSLDVTYADFDGSNIGQLNRLRKLGELSIGGTKIKGSDLVQLVRLRNLHALDLSAMEEVPLVLEKLRGSQQMSVLTADDCDLTDRDMPALAGISNLQYLSLKGDNISIIGLQALSSLSKLKRLTFSGPSLGPECIPLFGRLRHLDGLCCELSGLTSAQLASLRRALPPTCQILPLNHPKYPNKTAK